MSLFALPFFVAYFWSNKNWWAIIPAGVFTAIGLVSLIEELVPHHGVCLPSKYNELGSVQLAVVLTTGCYFWSVMVAAKYATHAVGCVPGRGIPGARHPVSHPRREISRVLALNRDAGYCRVARVGLGNQEDAGSRSADTASKSLNRILH